MPLHPGHPWRPGCLVWSAASRQTLGERGKEEEEEGERGEEEEDGEGN